VPADIVNRGLGWIPDLPDYRDHDVELGVAVPNGLPEFVRLDDSIFMPPVYDQLQLGSCTANALAAVVEFDLRRQGLVDFMPSRLFIYYLEREIEGSVEWDAGAMIRDGAKVLHKVGVPHEDVWPYDIGRFAVKPPPEAYAQAADTKSVEYARVGRFSMKRILATGTPFVVGFSVYTNFFRIGADGMMPMPDGDLEGGHAVVVTGYDTIDRDGSGDPFPGGLHYRVRNSWNSMWGDGGYFWMPSPYLRSTRLSSDFWAIKTVS
jgi:C1A family cysteine protease